MADRHFLEKKVYCLPASARATHNKTGGPDWRRLIFFEKRRRLNKFSFSCTGLCQIIGIKLFISFGLVSYVPFCPNTIPSSSHAPQDSHLLHLLKSLD
jgi:hypothetical protein